MHALTLLKTDHKKVDQLFKQFEKTKASARRKSIVAKIIKELSIHAAIEEQVFYPAIRNAVKKAEDMVLESLEEHHIVKWVLSELEGMDPDSERFEAKVTVLQENVKHHVKEEEQDLFPMVRKVMSVRDLNALGSAMMKAKRLAPKRPHPRAPDTPPGNIVAGMGAALVDRARDAVSGLARRGRSGARKGNGGRARANGAMSSRRRSSGAGATAH